MSHMKKRRQLKDDLGETLAQLDRELEDALAYRVSVSAGQVAMGWLLQDVPNRARDALDNLGEEQRAQVADAARKLAKMAEERA